MSLVSDPDYMIHQLRLTYLRNVEDPYASRLISFHPRHLENPHVLAAGLADPDRWPQLNMPSTPKPAPLNPSGSPILSRAVQSTAKEELQPRWTGNGGAVGGASLKYTTTILGPTRTGMMGMRTHGRRSSNSSSIGDKRVRADSNPVVTVQEASAPSNAPAPEARQAANLPEINANNQAAVVLPNFSRNAEMEARRKARIQARNALAELREHNLGHEKAPETPIPDTEEAIQDASSESESDSDSDEMGVAPDDELDPEFESQHLANSAGSDEGSLPSTASGISTSQSSGYPVQRSGRKFSQTTDNRLDTHTEEHSSDEDTSTSRARQHRRHSHHRVKSDTPSVVSVNVDTGRPSTKPRPPSLDLSTPKGASSKAERGRDTVTSPSNALENYFARKPISTRPSKPPASALTKMLVAQAAVTDNPFTELYGAIAGRGDAPSITLNIFFPESKKPFSATKLTARKDATVEEIIGFGLWTYCEQKLEPPLDLGEPSSDAAVSAAGWVLRIGEEDGEVDEDFPAPDRMAKISKFSFPAYAICKATPAQVAQNKSTEAKITRRLSRLMIAKKRPVETSTAQAPANAAGGPAAGGVGMSLMPSMGTLPAMGMSSSVGGSAHRGPAVFLRICVPEDTDAVLRYTTINVTSDWYMADVLEHICRRRKIANHKEYALVSQEKKIVIPMDRTVASLQGETELMLVKKTSLGEDFKPPGRATDPNASIFAKRMSELAGPSAGPKMDFTDAYQSWVVYRKLPVMVGRLERTLAIDGDHIHIMPSTKGFLDNVKTTSYRIDSIQSARQAKKAPSNVKIKVSQDGTNKTYDFEAENEATAEIIVQRIKALIKSNPKRASTLRRK
ncbi:hypothetical protein M408DRAFT_331981 [Serendipita vermifera MAFF 305830]|uniref:Sin1 middle CRIM domain-containing protein n=1 Tax=Serendipita vermifera MAFF 305830 TaxID=933852 RepID=A0A0C2WC86_SERVB|nr:hypothetical protein M408DRAFT_331981 [Serendipita vermifera MAFF 305830]